MWDTLIQDQFLRNVEQLLYFSKSVFLVVRRLSWWSFPRCIAAFIVADIHIHQIIAVTSMSSISSLCWRLNFCRPHEQIRSRWPTLFLDILTLCWDNFVPFGFLVVFRHGSLRTGVHLYIWMPHVITRCCVVSQTSRNESPRTGTVRIRTLCFEHHRVFNMHSNRIPLQTDRQSSTQNSSLVFSTTQVSSCINLFYLSEGSWLSWNGQMNILKCSWNWKNGEDDSIRHGWLCLSSTCLRVGVGIDHFDLHFWSELILSKLVIKRKSVGLG